MRIKILYFKSLKFEYLIVFVTFVLICWKPFRLNGLTQDTKYDCIKILFMIIEYLINLIVLE